MEDIDRIILSTLTSFLGEPKNPLHSEDREWWEFNCPSVKCREDQDKFNLCYNPEKKIYHCWKCKKELGTKGFVHKLVETYGTKENINRINLILPKYKANLVNVFQKPEINYGLITCKLPGGYFPLNKYKDSYLYRKAYDYVVNKRKVSPLLIDKFKIGYTETGIHKNRIIIPSFNEFGKLNYFEARTFLNIKPPYLKPSDPDKDIVIFNEGNINWNLPVYLVEGPFDMLRIPNSICMLGKAPSYALINKILEKQPKIILCLDEDAFWETKDVYKMLHSLGIDIFFIDLRGLGDVSGVFENAGQTGISNLLKTVRKLDFDFQFGKILKGK